MALEKRLKARERFFLKREGLWITNSSPHSVRLKIETLDEINDNQSQSKDNENEEEILNHTK